MSFRSQDTLSRESRLRDLADRKEELRLEREVVASKLENLDYKIIQTQAEYGAFYNEAAPILNLPIEILCRMFEAAHNASFAEGIPNDPLIEVTISHICRGLRSIALSFPLLWSRFRYDAPELLERIPVDRRVAYLERSGSRLLDLHFASAESIPSKGSLALFNSMLESTIPHVARWRRFSLFSDRDVPVLAFCDRLQHLEAPNLEYFTMCPALEEPETPVFDVLFPSVFLGGAPKLFYLRLDPTCPSKYLPPFSNVTVLRLEDESLRLDVWNFGSYSTFLEILALPSLSSLSIVGEQFSQPDSPHSSKITMNNLKHLRYGADDNLIGHFLPFLFAPLLETLILSNIELPLPPSPFPKFMRPFSKLHSLELINCIDTDIGFFTSFAALTPHITNLTIVDGSSSETIFQYMVEQLNDEGTTLWPNVKILTGILFHEDSLNHYISFAKMFKNPELIICTGASFASDWRSMDPEGCELLQSICILEQMPAGKRLVSWPPGVDVPAEDDFFTIQY
ncbi:hypothetical protein K443DRAFT_572439 [Laccaria amethystina LaAM-08-1]|uniref:F-box domain-containing protein n=1 Tax=Laccaria amethystina LaAM-08-1 TaxID=1095629 RepID=A0A0C9WRR7_9AGAR|nr:hypothetical protein K443DRAFT_572439 [Laccaria amethystina LaAM-08-1]